MTTIEPAGVAEVLAILGHGELGAPVTETAAVIAQLADSEVRQVRLAAGFSPQQAARQVMRALHQPRTVCGVLAADQLSRPLWQPVAQQSAKPVVLVPAEARDQPPRIRRILLPLDGTAQSASAVAGTAERLARGGTEIVVLHVFDARTVPSFWNQHAHAGHAWEQEFLARYCALPGARLELRSGAAAEHVVKVAGAEQADMIALAWSQRLEPGRRSGQSSAVPENRVHRLEVRVAALTEILRVSAHGLEDPATTEPESRQEAEAGRQGYSQLPVADPPPAGPVSAQALGGCRGTGSLRG